MILVGFGWDFRFVVDFRAIYLDYFLFRIYFVFSFFENLWEFFFMVVEDERGIKSIIDKDFRDLRGCLVFWLEVGVGCFGSFGRYVDGRFLGFMFDCFFYIY